MERNFVKSRSVMDVVISTLIIVLGCILAIVPLGAGVAIGGYMLIILGFLLALIMKSEYREELSGEKYIKQEHFFPKDEKNQLLSALASAPGKIDLGQKGKGQVLRLDIYYSKALDKCYIQLFEYVPYQYAPCSQLVGCELAKISNLLEK
ncbi:MAG: hypothetical protein IIX41_05885 [Bacteroidales bacterium]|nr:hypothetical protein [Bacteroidales bacterium]